MRKVLQIQKYSGWIVFDKPEDISSAQAIAKIKALFARHGIKTKIGHTGTLDPFASGLLLVAVGCATKLIEYLDLMEKIYEFEVQWGIETETMDRKGKVIYDDSKNNILYGKNLENFDKKLSLVLKKFIGEIEQSPHIFSAIKLHGKRAYDLARNGSVFSLPKRAVHSYELKLRGGASLLCTKRDRIVASSFYLRCGKGFYVRSLAKDIAVALGTRCYVKKLRRVAIGGLNLQNALRMSDVDCVEHVRVKERGSEKEDISFVVDIGGGCLAKNSNLEKGGLERVLHYITPIDSILSEIETIMTKIDLEYSMVVKIIQGQLVQLMENSIDVRLKDFKDLRSMMDSNNRGLAAVFYQKSLVAVCTFVRINEILQLKAVKVFCNVV